MKKFALVFFICLITTVLLAHEFWLQPDKFIYQPGESIHIKFLVGENFEGENWGGNVAKIESLTLYQDDVEDDLSTLISEEKGDSLEFGCYEEGNVMVAYHSNNSFIQLEPAKFNAYLEEGGLSNAITYRKEHNETDSASREFYQRSVKTILQIGEKTNNTFSRKTNLPLDIIPLYNPYILKNGDSLTAKIFFQKKIFANALIKIWHRDNNKTEKQELTTNEKGEIGFPVTTTGAWMISTVKMEHLDHDAQASWQSYWGSLTWGYLK
jgi:uncharacterized GH25 family protein